MNVGQLKMLVKNIPDHVIVVLGFMVSGKDYTPRAVRGDYFREGGEYILFTDYPVENEIPPNRLRKNAVPRVT